MMQNVITHYRELLYAFLITLNKIMIVCDFYFAKLHYLEFELWEFCTEIMYGKNEALKHLFDRSGAKKRLY